MKLFISTPSFLFSIVPPFLLISFSFAFLFFFATISNVVEAQVAKKGKLKPLTKSMRTVLDPKARFQLPIQDNDILIQNEQDKDLQSSYLKPFKFATAIDFVIDMETGGEWTLDSRNNLRIWRAEISSANATSLSLILDKFYLPPNSELYIIGSSVRER